MTQAKVHNTTQVPTLIQAAKNASDLIDLFLSSKNTQKVASASSIINKNTSADDNSILISKCSSISKINSQEYEQLNILRSSCKAQILESMEILEEMLQRYK